MGLDSGQRLGTVVFALGGLIIAVNLRMACRPVEVVPRSAPWFGGFIIAAVVALAPQVFGSRSRPFGATPSGVTDPVLGKDLSFYLLALPLYEDAPTGARKRAPRGDP